MYGMLGILDDNGDKIGGLQAGVELWLKREREGREG